MRTDWPCFTVACWFRRLAGAGEQGSGAEIVDRRADELRRRARLGGPDPTSLLGLTAVFGERLAASPEFRDGVARALRDLYEKGARAALAEINGRRPGS